MTVTFTFSTGPDHVNESAECLDVIPLRHFVAVLDIRIGHTRKIQYKANAYSMKEAQRLCLENFLNDKDGEFECSYRAEPEFLKGSTLYFDFSYMSPEWSELFKQLVQERMISKTGIFKRWIDPHVNVIE